MVIPPLLTQARELWSALPDMLHRGQQWLLDRGLLVRECSNYCGLEVGSRLTGPGLAFETRGHLRFCVRNPDENDLLLATLADIMTSRPPGRLRPEPAMASSNGATR